MSVLLAVTTVPCSPPNVTVMDATRHAPVIVASVPPALDPTMGEQPFASATDEPAATAMATHGMAMARHRCEVRHCVVKSAPKGGGEQPPTLPSDVRRARGRWGLRTSAPCPRILRPTSTLTPTPVRAHARRGTSSRRHR